MAVAKTMDTNPYLLTLDDGTEHTITVADSIFRDKPGFTCKFKVISATDTVKFNTAGDAGDSNATYAVDDEDIVLCRHPDGKLRVKGTASDTIRLTVA